MAETKAMGFDLFKGGGDHLGAEAVCRNMLARQWFKAYGADVDHGEIVVETTARKSVTWFHPVTPEVEAKMRDELTNG